MFNFSQQEFFEIILRIPIVLISLSVHEMAHAYAAYKLGDPTARNLGRFSLNPLKHLDPIGTICLLLFRMGWAKPVPINTRYFRKPRRDMAISALAGPVSNLLMGFIGYIFWIYIYRFSLFEHFAFYDTGAPVFITSAGKILYMLMLFFENFFLLNVSLAVFNLFPIPPLDGSRIMFVLLPDRVYFGIMKYEQFIYIAFMAGLWFGAFDGILNTVFGFFISIFGFITQFLPFL